MHAKPADDNPLIDFQFVRNAAGKIKNLPRGERTRFAGSEYVPAGSAHADVDLVIFVAVRLHFEIGEAIGQKRPDTGVARRVTEHLRIVRFGFGFGVEPSAHDGSPSDSVSSDFFSISASAAASS